MNYPPAQFTEVTECQKAGKRRTATHTTPQAELATTRRAGPVRLNVARARMFVSSMPTFYASAELEVESIKGGFMAFSDTGIDQLIWNIVRMFNQ